jgi:hypothetical protein
MQLEPSFPPGTEVAGKYVVEKRLGAGGMGVVLAVRHKELGERYALKLMLPAASASDPARERFAREAKAAARLKSEHVARAIDFGFLSDGGAPFMVLELLEGQNLAERLSERGPLEPREIARLMLDACDALREAHAEGIVHRDLKPANLFCTPRRDGTTVLKVLDFGIAKTLAQDSAALTKTATTMGSPFYMSPEQMRSAKSADARSDVWSLGVTMFELATGRLPFVGETVTEVAILVIEAAVPSPTTYVPDLPPEFVQIVLRCLQKDPARRYADVEDLAEDLAAFLGKTWARTSPRRVASIVPSQGAFEPGAAFAPTEFHAAPAGTDTVAAAPLAASIAPVPVAAVPVRPLAAAPLARPARSPWSTVGLVTAGVVGVGVVAVGVGGLSFVPSQSPSPPARLTDPGEVLAASAQASRLEPSPSAQAAEPAQALSAAGSARPEAPRAELEAVLQKAKIRLRKCFDGGSVATKSVRRSAELHLFLGPTGALEKPPSVVGEGFDDGTRECFLGVLSNLKFPPVPESTQIRYPMTFEPAPPPTQRPKGIVEQVPNQVYGNKGGD